MAIWLCGYVALWLCGYGAMGLRSKQIENVDSQISKDNLFQDVSIFFFILLRCPGVSKEKFEFGPLK